MATESPEYSHEPGYKWKGEKRRRDYRRAGDRGEVMRGVKAKELTVEEWTNKCAEKRPQEWIWEERGGEER